MKKKIAGLIVVLVIAAIAAWNVSFGSKTDMLSDVALANVEALAQGEDPLGVEFCLSSATPCRINMYYDCVMVYFIDGRLYEAVCIYMWS